MCSHQLASGSKIRGRSESIRTVPQKEQFTEQRSEQVLSLPASMFSIFFPDTMALLLQKVELHQGPRTARCHPSLPRSLWAVILPWHHGGPLKALCSSVSWMKSVCVVLFCICFWDGETVGGLQCVTECVRNMKVVRNAGDFSFNFGFCCLQGDGICPDATLPAI